MPHLNTSEQAFEDYLERQGIEFEPIPTQNAQTPDYRLNLNPTSVIAEVKQFTRSLKTRVGGYCPVPFVRYKIKASWKQFELYQDQMCCLVLYNDSSSTVFLEPELVLCAMFGEYLERLPGGAYLFSGTAAMQPSRNTRISALVALLPLRVRRNCVEAGRRMFALTNAFTRELTEDETLQIHRETVQYAGQVEDVTRAVVFDNPFAQNPLVSSIFTGPYDERWARVEDGSVQLTFSGDSVAELRSLLPEYALKMMGLW